MGRYSYLYYIEEVFIVINDILNDIEKIDAICFIHEHRMMNALSELYAKQQMILEYTKNEIAQEFTIFQESVLPEDDDREIHEFVDVPKQRYELYTDDDDKFESFIMEMFVQEASSSAPTEFPDDPNKINVNKTECMYQGFISQHESVAIQLILAFNSSHANHNNEQGDGVAIKLNPNLPYLNQSKNLTNAFISTQNNHKVRLAKYFNIYRTFQLVNHLKSDVFGCRVMRTYTDSSTQQTMDVTLSKKDPDPAMLIYFDVNIPRRIVSDAEVRAMKALKHVTEMQNDLVLLKKQPTENQNKTEIKNLEKQIRSYTNYANKVLRGADVNTIRKEACLDTYDKTYIVSQQLSFHLPRPSSPKITRLKNNPISSMLGNINKVGKHCNLGYYEFYNNQNHGIPAAKVITKTFRIGP